MSRGKWKVGWNLANVSRVEDVPSLPSLQGSRDSCKVGGLQPHFLTVILTDLS